MISILIDLDNTLYPKKYSDKLAKEIGFTSFDDCPDEVKDYIISRLYRTLKVPANSILDCIPNSRDIIIYLVSKKYSVVSKLAFFELAHHLKFITSRRIIPIPDISRKKTFEILRPDITIHDYDENIDEYCDSELIFRVRNYIIEETKHGIFISELETPNAFYFYQVNQSHSFTRIINDFCEKTKKEELKCLKDW